MLVHECLVGALETSAPPKRVAWVWQDAIPSYDCSVGALLALEAAKPSGDKCTPWEKFCGFCVFCGKTLRCLVGAAGTAAPPERLLQAFYLFY